jgi:hypothetical protein
VECGTNLTQQLHSCGFNAAVICKIFVNLLIID